MHEKDARRLQSLGFGHRDIVFLQRRDHVGAKHAHDSRPFGERERQRGQHEEAQISDRILLERHVTGSRQPSKLHRKQVDQQNCRQECRHRQHAEGTAGHEAVESAAAAYRASYGQGNADGEANDFGQRHQLDRYRQPFGHRLQHGLSGTERSSKIALQHVTQPAEVAPPDWPIEAHVMAQGLDFLRGRLIAQDHVSEIARQQRGDQECQ